MIISDLNPLQFWILPTPHALDPASATAVIDLSALALTFNGEDKDSAVEYHPYFHVVKSNDQLLIQIVVDDDSHTFKLSGRNKDGTLWQNFDLVQVSGSYFSVTVDLSLYPAIVGKKIFFAVVDDTDNLLLAVTDHNNVKETVSKSVLITYSNDSDFENVLAGTEMKLRVPGVFVHSEFPEETETDELSDGSIVVLTGSVKTQKTLSVEPVPDFIHKKIKYLLKCSDLSIKGQNWKQEEAHVPDPPPNTMYELKRGKVKLTLDGSVVRQVYAP